MGIIESKICAVCGKEVGLNRYRIKNKEWICPDCFKKCGGRNAPKVMSLMTVEEIKYIIDSQNKKKEELLAFHTTKKIGTLIEFDENQKKWLVPDGIFGGKKHPQIYNYSDIIDFELLEDEESITKGGLGRAVAGGVLFGGVGAVVGGVTGHKKHKSVCNNLKIKITVNNINKPTVYINLINTATKKDSFTYKASYNAAQEVLSTLQLICNNLEQQNNIQSSESIPDQIKKLAELKEQGILTEEEFTKKKTELLAKM